MIQARPTIETTFHGPSHIAARLDWLRRLLAWQADLARIVFGAIADDAYRGLYIADAEADVLGQPEYVPEAVQAARAALARERAELAEQAEADSGDPLLRLARLFNLSPFEQDVLLLALLPETSLRLEKLIAFVQDDVTKKRPTVDLALRLFCETDQWHAARAAFAPDAPLLRYRLVQLYEDGQRNPPLLARFIKIDDRIAAGLLACRDGGRWTVDGGRNSPPLDPAIAPFVELRTSNRSLEHLLLPTDLVAQLRRAANGGVLALQGGYGSGRRAVAEALSAEQNQPLLSIDMPLLLDHEAAQQGAHSAEELFERVTREATLRGAALLWQSADRLLAEDAPAPWRDAWFAALREWPGQQFLAIERAWEARGMLRRFLRIELPAPTYAERAAFWQRRVGEQVDAAVIPALASTFRLSAGQIRDAARMACMQADMRGEEVTKADLYAACRAQSSGKLDALAHKIRTTYAWNDIVLPADQVAQLREICIQVRQRATVLEQWGFERRLAMGKGVNVLFAGQSGTGKTMAAEIIAAELGLELYKIDLSSMVSKYIGETEKNLDKVFTAAGEANAILFFDEADALFGKRSEVKDAHDRYANIEVGYLLQKMEEYDGVVILATNLRRNMDDAFVRRLHTAVDFPLPEEDDRKRIWQKVFPPEAPLAADVDLEHLAQQHKLTGGNIRNIALLAAFLAAEDGATIGMAHVGRAVRREYQKLGRLVSSEFGR